MGNVLSVVCIDEGVLSNVCINKGVWCEICLDEGLGRGLYILGPGLKLNKGGSGLWSVLREFWLEIFIKEIWFKFWAGVCIM